MMRMADMFLVTEALDNAWENGTDLDKWTVCETVEDLQRCCAGCDIISEVDLRRYVKAWRIGMGIPTKED